MSKANQASISYWRGREEAAKKAYIKEEAQYQKAVNEVYKNMLDECQKEINAFYAKYADKEGITIAEAKKRASQLDINEYARKAERYVKEKNLSPTANKEMSLYNLTMKVNRLELLKAKLGAELVGGFDQIDKITSGALTKRTINELKRQAGILGESVGNQKNVAKTIVNGSFHNATFSEDIWGYQSALKNSLDTLLQRGLIQGKHPRVLAREIEKAFGSSRYEAERLMRTELARVQTQAAEETFRANEYEQYIFLPHDNACNVCLSIKEEVYNVDEMEIGVNAPPMHPNCRCSIAAYMDRVEQEEAKRKYKYASTVVSPSIKSNEFLKKFTQLGEANNVTREIKNAALNMLEHRSGTKYEDLAFVDTKTSNCVVQNQHDEESTVKMSKAQRKMLKETENYTIVGVHNHPNNSLPSFSDLWAAVMRKYKYGLIVCHNGTLIKFTISKEGADLFEANFYLDRMAKNMYNNNDISGDISSLKQCGVILEVI